MAEGKPVGTMFVELSMDATKYTTAQKQILAGAEQNSADINKVMATVGTKSDVMYNAMRQNVQNALDAIKQSHISSADEIRRAQEGAAQKINAINEQQFGKQTSFIDSMKNNWIVAAAAIGTAMMAAGKAWDYIEQGAKAQQAEDSFRSVADAAGESADAIIDGMKRAAAGTVDDSDIMQKAVSGMIKGLSGEKLVEIMESARVAARFAGEDVQTAYERITDAIGNGMPKALVKYGLVTRDEAALIKAALKEGVEETDLYGIAMINAAINAEKLGELQLTTAERLQIFKAQASEAAEQVGGFLITALTKAYGAFQWLAAGVLTAASVFPKFLQWVSEISAYVQEKLGNKEMAAAAEADAKRMQGVYETMIGAAGELADKATKNMVEQDTVSKQVDKDKIARLQEEKKQLLDGIKAEIDAKKNAEKISKEILDAETQANKSALTEKLNGIKLWLDLQKISGEDDLRYSMDILDRKKTALNEWYEAQKSSTEKNVTDERAKAAKLTEVDAEYNAEWKKFADERTLIQARMIKKAEEDAIELLKIEIESGTKLTIETIRWNEARDKAASDLYKNLKGYGEEEYTATIKALHEKKVAWEAFGLNTDAITQRMEEETIKAEAAKLIASGEFIAGVSGGLKLLSLEHTTWATAGVAVVKTMSTSMTTAFSTGFEDIYQGKMKSIGDYAEGIWDSVRKTFFDMAGKIAAEKVMGMFELGWSGGSAGVLGVLDKVLDWGGEFWDSLEFEGFADGGMVPGYAYGGDSKANDTVPAWLSPGEFVMPRSAVNSNTIGLLESMRSGGGPQFSYGDPGEEKPRWGGTDWVDRWGNPWKGTNAKSYFPSTPYPAGYEPIEASIGPRLLEKLNKDLIYSSVPSQKVSEGITAGWDAGVYALAPDSQKDLKKISHYYEPNWETRPNSGQGEPFIPGYYGGIEHPAILYGSGEIMERPTNWNPLTEKLYTDNTWKFMLEKINTQRYPSTGGINELFGIFVPMLTMAIMSYCMAVAAPYILAELGLSAGAAAGAGGLAAELEALGFTAAEIESMIGTLASAEAGGASYGSAEYLALLEELGIGELEVAGMSETGGMWSALTDFENPAYWENLFSQAALSGEDYLKKMLIKQAMKQAVSFAAGTVRGQAPGKSVNVNFGGFTGGDSWSMLQDLGGIIGMEGKFSARNGLDYVPRDNFGANLHEGEAVLNRKAASAWRGGADSGELASEIKALREELRAANFQIARNTAKTARAMEFLDNELNTDGILTRTS